MSELATTPEAIKPGLVRPDFQPVPQRRSRGLLEIAASEALRSRGALLGLLWIAVAAFFAVFAPLLANSRPLVARIDNVVSSPLLQGLQWTDWFVLLVAGSAVAAAVVLRRVGVSWLLLLVTGLTLVLAGSALYLAFGHRSDDVVVYSEWREAAAAGHVQWAVYAPIPFSPDDYLRDQFDVNDPYPWSPRPHHWLGTDTNGADIASRMIHACRIALSVGLVAEGVSLLVGVTVGALMGYFGAAVDLLGMRVIEIFSAIPQFYLLLTCVAFFSRNLYLIMLIIGLTSWPGYAVFIRAQFLSLRNQDFVQSARAAGLPTWRIVFLHMLPNGIAPVLVSATFGVASAITSEAGLSFLGIGPVDVASWGALLNQALNASHFYWWLGVFPGTAIFLTVMAYNLIGESLRDALDPRALKRE